MTIVIIKNHEGKISKEFQSRSTQKNRTLSRDSYGWNEAHDDLDNNN